MPYYSSGKLDYKSHSEWSWAFCVRMCGQQNIQSNKGVAIIKYTPSYASQTQIEHGFANYHIVSVDGTHFVRDAQQTIDADVNGYIQTHSSLSVASKQNTYPTYVDPSESDYYTATTIQKNMYKTVPPGPYPGVDYWDGDLYDSANLPIFNFNGSDGINGFNNYLDTGDDSGAENYEDLHPITYETTVWIDGEAFPNLSFKTESGGDGVLHYNWLATCTVSPSLNPHITVNHTYKINDVEYINYNEYEDAVALAQTHYRFKFEPDEVVSADYLSIMDLYVSTNGQWTAEGTDGAKHTIQIIEGTPTDEDYPEDNPKWNNENSYNRLSGANTLTQTYKLNATKVKALGNFLWSSTFKDDIMSLTNDPMENIISLKAMPLDTMTGTEEVIKIGNVSTGITATKIERNSSGDDADSWETTVGNFKISPPFQNFIDYSEIDVKIYLPFIGFKTIDPIIAMGRTGRVKYIFDSILGNCLATIEFKDKDSNWLLYDCYQGNCGIDIAVCATNRGQIENGYVNNALSAVHDIMSLNPVGVAKDVYNGMTQSFHSSSNGVGNPSLMTALDTKCRLIIKRPQKFDADSQNYGHIHGYPCHLYKTLDEFSNSSNNAFVKCENVVLSLIPNALDSEKEELKQLLESGVFV